jgi:hypothetical protein
VREKFSITELEVVELTKIVPIVIGIAKIVLNQYNIAKLNVIVMTIVVLVTMLVKAIR